MGRTVRADMYGNDHVRRRAAGGYGEPRYNRRVQGGGSRKAENRRVAWEEPVYEGRRKNVCRKKRRKTQYKILRGILIYFIIAGIAATCFMIFSIFAGGKEKVHAEDRADAYISEETDGFLHESGPTGAVQEITPQIRQECQELFAESEPLLVLVNKEHELPASYEAGLRSICEGRLQAADILYEDLCAMLKDGGQAGFQYWIASAHRGRSYQQGLVDEDVRKYMAKGYSREAALEKTYQYTMPAGKSEHETGLALDILCSTNTLMDESQKDEPGNRWLAEHCHEYGFILRYPEDKESITGIGYEPWHFRYVGKGAAAYLKEKGWTLEEFYEAI